METLGNGSTLVALRPLFDYSQELSPTSGDMVALRVSEDWPGGVAQAVSYELSL